jgi:hypothetical protein
MAIVEAKKPRRIKRFENTIVKTFLWEAVIGGSEGPPLGLGTGIRHGLRCWRQP